MGKAILFAAVSLDGFIADEHDRVGPLSDWYGNGDVVVTFSDEERVFRTTRETADSSGRPCRGWRPWCAGAGCST
jgi:hypothetical protein